ncbi:MAG: GNAT family N-acetyltransferase, partial [Anaerolineae bacterium]|nr:GNAT family N-acetyltransferase [Anaerolineae bacterium]
GLQPFGQSWIMLIEFDSAPPFQKMPDGISLRTHRHPQDLSLTYQATRDSFQDHFGYVEEPFEQGLERWRHYVEGDEQFDESLWFLAIDDSTGAIAGISLCRLEAHHASEQGWVSTLGVCRPYRRRGLGLALLQHSFAELWNRGKQKVSLGVDASSLTGATRLYERAGMHVDRQMTQYEKELRPGVEISTTSVEG